MGARLNVVFHRGSTTNPSAVVYGHWAGDNPVDAASTLKQFFEAVESQTSDTRYTDPCYLAAKYVVFLAGESNSGSGKPLDFLSVGVVTDENSCGPECIAYVDCSTIHTATKRPIVKFQRNSKPAEELLGQI